MRILLVVAFFVLFSCVAQEKPEVGVASSIDAKSVDSESPDVLKALGEKDCDEKAKKIEENPGSIDLKKSNQGCTLE